MPAEVEVKGLKELRRALRDLDKEWPKQLRLAHKAVADMVAAEAQSRARGMGGVQAKAAPAIKGYATQTSGSVGVGSSKRLAMAAAAFWGAKRRSGWYAASKYRQSRGKQLPEWVGNSWDAAVAGQGPYAINDALAAKADEVVDTFWEHLEDLTSRAFPD